MSGNVQQSGNVTPGHLVKFITSGVVGDAGPLGASQRVLAFLSGADFNSVQDQPLIVPNTITAFQLTGLLITNATQSISVATGGFYTGASKGGSVIVSSAQVYSTLTGANLLLNATLTAFANTARFSGSNLTSGQIFFSLTTPQGFACFADIYALGIDLTI